MEETPAIHIGTSGWTYSHWKGIFYPSDLSARKLLTYYSGCFQTVEINSSFYHLPRESTFVHWGEQVPSDFVFALKGWGLITHRKKLIDCGEPVATFLQRADLLRAKLGPILWQLPPKFRYKEERIESFFRILPGEHRYAVEVRDPSFIDPAFFRQLREYGIAFCIADTPVFPYAEEITADFVYLRLHGHERLYSSEYTEEQLSEYAEKIRGWKKETYVYFDNDFQGFAVENAIRLRELLAQAI